MIAAYAALGTLAAPYLRHLLRRRLARGKEDPARIGERTGLATLPRPPGRLIWLHAASLGETQSILPVIDALAGHATVLLTTGTLTSARLAAARLPPDAIHQFTPLDIPAWTARFLDHWRPDCAVFVESEIWPTTLRAADRCGIPRLLINARMSPRSAANWARLRSVIVPLLDGFRHIHAQSPRDAAALRRLGYSAILEWGNLKYAAPVLPADETPLAALRAQLPGPAWLAASTHPGEDELILQTHQALLSAYPDLITIIAPRHPERGAAIAPAAPHRARQQPPVPGQPYIADTMGELGLLYRAVPFTFIGGSLVPHGGQNVIEPAKLSLGILTGPHNYNFADPVALLKQAGALQEITAQTLTQAVQAWLQNPAAATAAGTAARFLFTGFDDLPTRLAGLILAASL